MIAGNRYDFSNHAPLRLTGHTRQSFGDKKTHAPWVNIRPSLKAAIQAGRVDLPLVGAPGGGEQREVMALTFREPGQDDGSTPLPRHQTSSCRSLPAVSSPAFRRKA